MDFVVHDDVPDQRVWDDSCFQLDLFSVEGDEQTKAEALSKWVTAGYSWRSCLAHLASFRSVTPKARSIPEEWRKAAMKRLREQLFSDEDGEGE